MSTLTITNAGLDYKNAVLAGTEQTNITHMLFANVPGIDATTAPSVNSTIPAQHIVHSQTVERVSNLDGNALVISAILDYSIGDFEFNWFGAVATKSNGEQILVAVVHTHPQTKTKTDGPNVGDYSVKSIVWQSQQLGENVAVNIATQPWQVENDVFATINSSPSFKNATFDNGTSTTVNINADSAGMAVLNVCSGTSDAQTTGRVYVGQSFRHGGGIEYNGDNTPATTGAGADFVTLFRKQNGQLHWTARNYINSNDWEFRGAVESPNFIEGGTSLKDKYHGKSDKLARLESSFIDATGQDFRIRNKRALVGFEDKLIINFASDWSHVDAGGTWRFTGNIERNSHNSGYLVGSYHNVGDNRSKTNPIYTIGSGHNPSETELNNMYGIGYTHATANFVPFEGSWGMYVAADGDARIFLDASHGRVHTTGDVYEAGTKLSDKYLGKTAKAADAAKLEGKTKAQVISEARTGLTKIDYQSDNFYDRSFRLAIPANSTVPFPDLPATACDILVFGSTDMTGTSTNFVGRFTKYGSTWSANTIYGSSNSTNYPSIAIVNNQPAFKNHHGIAVYPFEYKCWIACQSNANAKPFEFFANAYSTQNKPTPADISDKLARFENSFIDINYGGQDLKIRSKRALVGSVNELSINHGTDWQNVKASGKWQFADSINTNGDITVTKNNPWLTLDSAGTGNNNNEQAAGISLGESGRINSASLHISYIGDGYSYIGMGNLGPDNVADKWAMKMQYQNTWVQFRSALLIGDGNTSLSKGGGNSLRIKSNHGYVDIGPKNSGHCHYATDRSSHWFDKNVNVNGEIYAGSGYNKRVLHEGNISGYAEKRTVKASGALTANSKNHLTATAPFTLPDVTNLSEGTTVVTSKAMAVTPTIKTHGAEHIAMVRGTTMLTDTSVLFDRHCTLTFILNSAKNWEMQ